jgi:hypothetical protein
LEHLDLGQQFVELAIEPGLESAGSPGVSTPPGAIHPAGELGELLHTLDQHEAPLVAVAVFLIAVQLELSPQTHGERRGLGQGVAIHGGSP